MPPEGDGLADASAAQQDKPGGAGGAVDQPAAVAVPIVTLPKGEYEALQKRMTELETANKEIAEGRKKAKEEKAKALLENGEYKALVDVQAEQLAENQKQLADLEASKAEAARLKTIVEQREAQDGAEVERRLKLMSQADIARFAALPDWDTMPPSKKLQTLNALGAGTIGGGSPGGTVAGNGSQSGAAYQEMLKRKPQQTSLVEMMAARLGK